MDNVINLATALMITSIMIMSATNEIEINDSKFNIGNFYH